MGGIATLWVYKGWLVFKPGPGEQTFAYRAWGQWNLRPREKPVIPRDQNVVYETGGPDIVSPDLKAVFREIDQEEKEHRENSITTPEEAAYKEAIRQAQKAYMKATDEVVEVREKAMRQAEMAYDKAKTEAAEVYEKATDRVWEALKAETPQARQEAFLRSKVRASVKGALRKAETQAEEAYAKAKDEAAEVRGKTMAQIVEAYAEAIRQAKKAYDKNRLNDRSGVKTGTAPATTGKK